MRRPGVDVDRRRAAAPLGDGGDAGVARAGRPARRAAPARRRRRPGRPAGAPRTRRPASARPRAARAGRRARAARQQGLGRGRAAVEPDGRRRVGASRSVRADRPARSRSPGRRRRQRLSRRRAAAGAPSSSRTVSCGSSASTVPVPTTMASHSARSRCTSARAASPVIHRLVPSAAAVRPSSVAAYFQVTNGAPGDGGEPAALSACASSARTPASTSTPARAAVARRRPRAGGVGRAKTTRATPASSSACVQGPVRPVWSHGSSVTTAVPPGPAPAGRARARRPRRAGCRLRGATPSPTTWPSGARRTQPTRGFGLVGCPTARRARRRGASRRSRRGWPREPLSASVAAPGARGWSSQARRGQPRHDSAAGRACPRVASHPDFHRRSRSSTGSTGRWLRPGRGLSPPVRNCTDPGTHECSCCLHHQCATPSRAGGLRPMPGA